MRRIMACVVALLGCATGCATKPSITPIPFDAFPRALRITNKTVDVIVVPSTGRIVRYGYVGGPNLLWDNPALRDRPAVTQPSTQPSGRWTNWGGEKIYPWPQSAWPARFGHDWPPPPGVDPLAYHAESLPDGTLRLTSDIIPAYNIRVVRELRLAPAGTRFTTTTAFEQIALADRTGPVAVWAVAQWRSPDVVLARRSTPHGGPMVRVLRGTFASIDSQGSDAVVLRRPSDDVAKVGVDADVLQAGIGDTWITEHVVPEAPNPAFPFDRGQIYCTPLSPLHPDGAYVELEFTSPRRAMNVGESMTLRVDWELTPRP